jgi:hypothetical protein
LLLPYPNAKKYPPPLNEKGIGIMEEAFRQKLQESSSNTNLL